MEYYLNVLSFSCLVLFNGTGVSGKKELRLLGMLPMTGDVWRGGTACLPAVQMAIQDINANENILQNYSLTYNWVDSKCDPGMALHVMFEALYKDPQYVMILGAGCSVGSEATAQVTHLWNITQISFGSSSPILSNRNRFPRFYRMSLPDQKLNPARIDLMREFDWKKVATLNQALEFFSAVIDDFVKSVQGTEITIISQEIFVNDPLTRVTNLKAFKVGLYGPKIVWVFVGWFTPSFWRVNIDGLDCTEGEMDLAAEGAYFTGPFYSNPVTERGIADMTASEFEERYYAYPTYSTASEIYDFIAPQCYDHVWVAAKALECADKRMQEQDFGKSLDSFTYADPAMNEIIFECMGQTSLTGISGRVIFSSGADPNKVVKMERIQDSERQLVGLYRQDKDPSYFEWTEGAIKWKDNAIPRDSTIVTDVEVGIPSALYGTMATLAGLGICLTLFFFVFNVIYRNNKFVKLSSPNINNILLVGCVFCYATVFMKTTQLESATICKIRIFCFSLGFTLTFGALFSKTWRVYRIFTNKKLLKRTIKDVQLIAVIGGLSAIILLILILWESIGPLKIHVKYLPNEVYMSGNDAEVHPYVRVCVSEYTAIFGWLLYISQGALLSFGAFLAWETRQVTIKALNDSHQIGLCVYNVFILSAVGLTLSLLLDDEDVLMYGITSGCLILGTTMTQMIIFVPKMQVVRGKVDVNDLSTTAGKTSTAPVSTIISARQPSTAPVSTVISARQPSTAPVSTVISARQPSTAPVSTVISARQPSTAPVSTVISTGQPYTAPVSTVISARQQSTD